MNRSELDQLIREELETILQEKYTSAGTVPRTHKRKMTPAQVAKREQLGQKILSAIKTGGDKNPLRQAFKRWAEKNDHPINSEEKMNSYAWAMASDWAIKGKSFPPTPPNKKSPKSQASSDKKSDIRIKNPTPKSAKSKK